MLKLINKLRQLKIKQSIQNQISIQFNNQLVTIKSTTTTVTTPLIQFQKLLFHIQTDTDLTDFSSTAKQIESIINKNEIEINTQSEIKFNRIAIFGWIIAFNLYTNGIQPPQIAHTFSLFASCFDTGKEKRYGDILSLHKIKSEYNNYIFIPIDHNARQAAIICPVRLHAKTCTTFTDDIAHFSIESKSDLEIRKTLDKDGKSMLVL